LAERVVTEAPGALGRLRFDHALIRDALYDELATSKRLQLHRQTGEVLERLYERNPEPHVAELAHHFFEAAPGGDVGKAVQYGSLAGDRTIRLLAFEEAVRLYRMALQALELEEPPDEELRCKLLLALGDSQTRAGDRAAAKSTFLEAAALSRKLARSDHLARAALGYGGRFVWEADRGDANLVPLLEEALSVVPDEQGALRARLLARLAGGPLRDEVVRDRREALSREAVEIARELGDETTLAWVLDGRHAAVWWPENIDERLAIAGELIRVATAAGDKERVFQGHHYRWIALLEKGDMPATYAELEAQTHLAEELRQPAQLAYVSACRGTLAALEGKLEEAEELARQTFDLARGAYGSMADVWHAIQLYAVRRAQGRLDEVEELVARSAEEFPTYGVFRCILAHVEAELGREGEVRELFRSLADEDFVFAPPEEWVYGASLLADVAVFLGDVERASRLYELLLPYAGRTGVSAPDDCSGAVSRSLGVLAAALGRVDDATRHFEEALATNARMRARPWLAETQHDYARMLLRRDGPGDRERARTLLDEALATARALGMAGLERKVEEVGAARTSDSVFRREGEYWSVAYEGDAFRLRDTKGLRYVAALLATPGRELHVLDLVVAAEGAPIGAASAGRRELDEAGIAASGLGGADELLDVTARAAYKRRLDDLREDVEQAQAWGDPERAARAREEMQFLVDELSAATGLGGRTRRSASPAERARQSVTKAIKAAIERISEHSPALARHLEHTIRTGSFCRYEPDRIAPISWKI
jgi:tetratricopeptide (TPR) repeat protein